MNIFKRIFNGDVCKQPIGEKVEQTRFEVHKEKNKFTREMLKLQVRADRIAEETDRLSKDFKSSVAYKIAVASGNANNVE